MTTNVNIRLASDRVNYSILSSNYVPTLYTPGEVITPQQSYIR